MRISQIQSNYIANKTKYNSIQKTHQTIPAKNVSFGTTPESYAIARILMVADRSVSKQERTKLHCYSIIKNKIKENFPELLKELKVLNSNVDKGFLYNIGRSLTPTERAPKKIGELKLLALEDIFSVMDDSDTDSRIAKKDFMMSLVDSGEHLNQAFLKQFIAMPSKYYGGFKEGVVEKSIHSLLSRPELMHKAPDAYLFNLTMLKSIMAPEHQNFFNINKDEISLLFKNIETITKRKLTENRDDAYFNYLENFEKQKNWKSFTSDYFKKELIESGFDKENLMQRLNISEEFANLLLRELQVTARTKTGLNKEQKIEEYKTFIDEILKSEFRKIAYGETALYKKMAVEKFINSTDYKEELLSVYKPKLTKLQADYDRYIEEEDVYKRSSYKSELYEGGFHPNML